MSKYNHFEMCEKIFGQKYKWNEHKHDYEPYSRTDMWDKLVEQQQQIAELQKQLKASKQLQDKISFAIEQLEKVKGLIANHTQELWTCEDDIDVVLYEEIDNQINQLKSEGYHE